MPLAARSADSELIRTLEEAVAAAEALFADARKAVAGQVVRDGKANASALDREQRATHGLSWLATYVEFYDRYSGCIEAWAESTTDDPTIVSIGENGQVQIDIGAAKMLIRGPDRYPFDPVVSALILRALVTRVPQAALDLPEPIDDDELISVLMTCISRGFFGRAK